MGKQREGKEKKKGMEREKKGKVKVKRKGDECENKAGYTAKPVACCHAGAVMPISQLEYQKRWKE